MIVIVVYGSPAPQGSKRFVGTTKTGRGIMVESSKKVAPWREAVKLAALRVRSERHLIAPLDGPLRVSMTFSVPRPKSAPKSRIFPDRMPDLAKLIRSTEDALTDAGIWVDDARVVEYGRMAKVYVGTSSWGALYEPGCTIAIEAMA